MYEYSRSNMRVIFIRTLMICHHFWLRLVCMYSYDQLNLYRMLEYFYRGELVSQVWLEIMICHIESNSSAFHEIVENVVHWCSTELKIETYGEYLWNVRVISYNITSIRAIHQWFIFARVCCVFTATLGNNFHCIIWKQKLKTFNISWAIFPRLHCSEQSTASTHISDPLQFPPIPNPKMFQLPLIFIW